MRRMCPTGERMSDQEALAHRAGNACEQEEHSADENPSHAACVMALQISLKDAVEYLF